MDTLEDAHALHGKATKHHNDECRERIGTFIERTLTGKARMNAYKGRIAETDRVKQRRRDRVERGAGDVPRVLENRDAEQIAVRHADASDGDIIENQHEEDRMRDIHVGKRGPEVAGEEQLDKLRKTARFEQEASSSSAAASSEPTVSLEYLASGETQNRPRSALVQTSGHVDDDVQISALGGWNSLQPMSRGLLDEFIDKNVPWLLIGIPSRDPFLVTQYLESHSASSDQHMKKLTPLREGLHVMMHCYMRQHFVDRYWLHEHPGGHASWREPTMKKFTKESTAYFVKGPVCRWNVQKMRSESSEYVR